MQWLQDPNQSNTDNLHRVRRDANRHFRNENKEYTECPSRNLPDFGKMFLILKYTDITQNTYIQS
jgi:hypothetical protein